MPKISSTFAGILFRFSFKSLRHRAIHSRNGESSSRLQETRWECAPIFRAPPTLALSPGGGEGMLFSRVALAEKSFLQGASFAADERADTDVVPLEPALGRFQNILNLIGIGFDGRFIERLEIVNF